MDREAFASRLKNLRQTQGISQYGLADALGVSRTSLKNWELAIYMPPIEAVVEIALYFHVATDYLLGLEESRTIQVNFLSDSMVGALSNLVTTMECDMKNPCKGNSR